MYGPTHFVWQVKAGSPLQRLLFHWGYHRKLHNLKQGFSQATVSWVG